jgi:dTDP-4-amino-4,6-dideoxygalactose transaminase
MHPETRAKLAGMDPLPGRLWLSSPTMHGDELRYMQEAYETNWMSTVGANVDEVERQVAELCGVPHAVALSSGTAALHLAIKLAARRVYGTSTGVGAGQGGSLYGREVLCSDVTFDATVNPVVYEGGTPVFVDAERDTWNMDPEALEQAFRLHPEARIVVLVHLYGTPARMDEIRSVCDAHGAVVVEDAAESLGATYGGRPTGGLGDWGVASFNGNKIVTGSTGGCLLCHDRGDADRARKWSTQAREDAPWYQHEELGYNYRMSNVVAGVVRGQLPYLDGHVAQKRAIYERYRDGLSDLPVSVNPYDADNSEPNFWLSCLLVDAGAMCPQVRSGSEALYVPEAGRSCPTEVLEACWGRVILANRRVGHKSPMLVALKSTSSVGLK